MSRDLRVSSAPDIAIIGMACVFPGAADLQSYWQNIVSGVDAIGDPPADWEPGLFYDPESTDNDRTYCKRGGYLGPLATFDPLRFGVMPSSVEGEPDQFLALRVAAEALADAGYRDRQPDRERVEVVLGRGTYVNRGFTTVVQHGLVVDQVLRILKQLHPEHTDAELKELKRELKASLPAFNAEMAPALVPNLVSGRIANRLDFMGANYTVDAACASSHIAVERGVLDLQRGACDLAIVGGVHASTPAPILMIFSQLGALSRTGRLRPFDREADGTLLGEGVGLIVLKRREDAKRDGDRIYAAIRGIGVASDGRAVGLLAPRVEGEELALRRAYAQAGIAPETVELLEAHGTGTPVGDAAEIEALRRVFGARADGEPPKCALGSVKSMISHLIPAAGIAGIIKTALALHHKVLPATLHCEKPDPKLELNTTRFYINSETRPWIHAGTPRRAGVNAFGFGGINAHAILEEVDDGDELERPALHRVWDSEALLLSADSRQALGRESARLITAAKRAQSLRVLASGWNTQCEYGHYRMGVVASSLEDLQRKLEYATRRFIETDAARLRDVSGVYCSSLPADSRGRLAFVFPGEGSQYVNMLADLCVHFPQVRAWFDLIDRAFVGHMRRYLPSHAIFPPRALDASTHERKSDDRLWQMDCGAEAVFAASQALLELLTELGLHPDAVVGHSTGEYSALIASGANPISNRERLIQDIVDLNQLYEGFVATGALPEGVLLTVGAAPRSVVDTVVQRRNDLYVAMDNCPHQQVLFGAGPSIDEAIESVRAQRGICGRLPFSRAYHTPLFEPFCGHIAPFFARIPFDAPSADLYSCATAEKYPNDPDSARRLAALQWARPVRFRETVEAMYADGIRTFVEVGPRNNLSAFVDDTLGRRPHLAVPTNTAHRSGITQLNHFVAQLAVGGVPLRTDVLYRRRVGATERSGVEEAASAAVALRMGLQPLCLDPRRVRDGSPQTRPSTASGPALAAGAPAGHATARGHVTIPAADDPALSVAMASMPAGTRSQAVRRHLATMRRFLDVEHEVMEAYLAIPSVAAPAAAVATLPIAESALEHVEADEMPVPDATPEVGTPPDLKTALFELVCERTGYPPQVIGLDQDLESDLGIDSIKRVEILGALRHKFNVIVDMDRLTRQRTLRQILDTLAFASGGDVVPAAAPDATPPAAEMPELPLLGSVVSFRRGDQLTAERTLDIDSDRFLRDHTLGRNVSADDPALVGLPVMPLTVSIEMLAETAVALIPGKVVTAIRDIRAYRWIGLDRGHFKLQIDASRKSGPELAVDVRISARGDSSAPYVEGTVILSDKYEPAPRMSIVLNDGRPSRWNRGRLYDDLMFHGPSFRAVESVDAWATDGVCGTIRGLPRLALFRDVVDPVFVTDPVALDAAGQLIAYWLAEGCDRAFHIFPYSVGCVRFFGPALRAGDAAECRSRIRLDRAWDVRSDVEIAGADGALLCRVDDWLDRRFELPEEFYRLRVSPAAASVTRRWVPPVAPALNEGFSCRLVDTLPHALLEAHDGIWERVLAHLVLSRAEREAWIDLPRPPARRRDWLLGRLTAKDAIRDVLGTADLHPADIELARTERGAPIVVRAGQTGARPTVSIAHCDGVAVAIAFAEDRPVGIDIERLDRPRRDWMAGAFSAEERRLIGADANPDASEWPLRSWCAKEAAAKAVGTGMTEGPRGLRIEGVDQATGIVTVTLQGAVLNATGVAGSLTCYTWRDGDLVGAICLPERS